MRAGRVGPHSRRRLNGPPSALFKRCAQAAGGFRLGSAGQATALMAVTLAAVVGVAAISVDVGNLYFVHFRVENAADAAALAGATELPLHPDLARTVAAAYAQKNGYTVDPTTDVRISNSDSKITVTVATTVQNRFARLLGFDTTGVSAASSAETGAVTTYVSSGTPFGTPVSAPPPGGSGTSCFAGLMPWGVQESAVEPDPAGAYPQSLVLKVGSDSSSGNFHAMALGAAGGSTYSQNIADGAQGTYRIGDRIATETGNMVGPTGQGFDALMAHVETEPGCTNGHTLVVTPVVTAFTGANGKTVLTIQGFALFTLTPSSWNQSLKTITGDFVTAEINTGSQTFTPCGGSADYGAYLAPFLTN